MEIILHPTIKHIAPIYEKEVIREKERVIYLGNQEACREGSYDTVISFVNPDIHFEPIQENHTIFRIYDHSSSPIESVFPEVLSALHLAKGKTLVHCGEAISRSPAFLLGYLMIHHTMTYDSAYTYLQGIKPDIKPNRGFIKFLKKLKSSNLENPDRYQI